MRVKLTIYPISVDLTSEHIDALPFPPDEQIGDTVIYYLDCLSEKHPLEFLFRRFVLAKEKFEKAFRDDFQAQIVLEGEVGESAYLCPYVLHYLSYFNCTLVWSAVPDPVH